MAHSDHSRVPARSSVDLSARDGLPERLTSRRGARLVLIIAAAVFLTLFGLLSSAGVTAGHDAAPPDSESARAAELAAQFPDADQQSLIVVATRTDGGPLSPSDMTSFAALGGVISDVTGHPARPPQLSEDTMAALIAAPVTIDDGGDDDAGAVTAAVREAIASHAPADLTVQVTGGPAFGADVAAAFDGANVTLLAVTIAIVAILLMITYRSPILWILPLLVVGLADQLANVITAAVGSALDLQFDAGIISVLVFGAGTNYALLLLSRYREELVAHRDHRRAMSVAWRRTVPAIAASNVTVVLSLLTLVLAVIPGTRGLGVAAAVGLVIALAGVVVALPPLMVVCGRRVFWPFVPRPGTGRGSGRVWGAIARRVVRHPGRALIAGVILLAIMALGLFGTSVGLSQAQKFRGEAESAAGLASVAHHFPAGETQPMWVIARTDAADRTVAAARGVHGVARVSVVATTADNGWTKIMVTGADGPGTDAALALVDHLRDAVHEVSGADAVVGGATATAADARAGNQRDFLLLVPLIMVVSLVILMLVLRSVLAPVLLLVTNVASAAAAIGAGAWLSRLIFSQQSLALQVPLLAFLFLVALGIDYTIFLAHRIRIEAPEHGTREATVRAVRHTGGVITSAGIVLAGVFVALGVLPLVVLGQLGVIVGLGVLVDTLVVRTVVVPAVFAAIGERAWWPRTRGPEGTGAAREHQVRGLIAAE